MKLMARRRFWRACVLEGMTGPPDRLRTALIIVTCTFVFFSLLLAPLCSASTEADARSAIVVAEQRVDACYVAVSEADKAGANVTNLLSTLDWAGLLLSRAELALQKGDFDSARNLAVQSKAALDGFDAQADSLKNAAEHNGFVDFWVNVVGSSVGTVAVIGASLAVWLWLRRKYGQVQEVGSNES